MYRLQSPQAPIARTARYDEYAMDEFPSGTNMVVAVLAYTGKILISSLNVLDYLIILFLRIG